MKFQITESELKQIIKEEAERAKKISDLKSKKEEIKKQLDELYSDEELEEETEKEKLDELFGVTLKGKEEEALDKFISNKLKAAGKTVNDNIPPKFKKGTPEYQQWLEAVKKYQTLDLKFFPSAGAKGEYRPVKPTFGAKEMGFKE